MKNAFKRRLGLCLFKVCVSSIWRVRICRILFGWQIGHHVYLSRGIRVVGEPLSEIIIGDNVTIDDGVILNVNWGACLRIGNGVGISRDVALLTVGHASNDTLDRLAKDIVIEDHAWIATRAIVLPGVTIGRYARVGAGSVVSRNVDPRCVYAGVPARKLSKL